MEGVGEGGRCRERGGIPREQENIQTKIVQENRREKNKRTNRKRTGNLLIKANHT